MNRRTRSNLTIFEQLVRSDARENARPKATEPKPIVRFAYQVPLEEWLEARGEHVTNAGLRIAKRQLSRKRNDKRRQRAKLDAFNRACEFRHALVKASRQWRRQQPLICGLFVLKRKVTI